MSKETGGPAFPDGSTNPWGIAEKGGMTLRDYFAAKAMQGVVEGMAARAGELIYTECAALSYEIADAMLAARGEK
jgi:hypothetical protein